MPFMKCSFGGMYVAERIIHSITWSAYTAVNRHLLAHDRLLRSQCQWRTATGGRRAFPNGQESRYVWRLLQAVPQPGNHMTIKPFSEGQQGTTIPSYRPDASSMCGLYVSLLTHH